MGKKQKKSKDRLDKFYYMAKEHGLRSRAAFKLIQLNKKYDFLGKAKCVIDLCAAPGGWLQVAAKYMPMASIKIGVDLVPIKPVKGCVTFTADITTTKCINLIKKELKHFKADVVMNDGAPNVGAEWSKDAFNQAELCLAALKLATEFLRKGGTFVTKVFRSKDYNSLIYVLNQLFNKVEATKPVASRTQSAEIFVVCQGYKAPDTIDPKFLDPKYAFEEVDETGESTEKISSLKKLMDNKRNRSGYGDKSMLYLETDFFDFLQSQDPYEYLSSYNKFIVDVKSQELMKKIAPPKNLEIYLQDIKVLGKRELHSLLKYRFKYQRQVDNEKKKERGSKQPVEAEPLNEEQIDEQIDQELELAIKKQDRETKKSEKKERERKAKSEMRQKMSVIASTDLGNQNDDILIDRKTFEKLKNIDIEEQDYDQSSSEEDEELDPKKEAQLILKQRQYGEVAVLSDEESGDEEGNRINRMNNEMEALYESQKEYQMERDKRLAKREKKKKALVEQQRKQLADLSEEERLDNQDVNELDDMDEEEEKGEPKVVHFASDDEEKNDKGIFLNPLLVQGAKGKKTVTQDDEVSEGEWSSEEEEKRREAEKTDKKKDSLLGKRKRGKDDDKDFFNSQIEIVPQTNLDADLESLDSDDMAETRALAKLMLRKKMRNQILDSTYNRYSNFDDKANLPKWFVEDEEKHYKAVTPITKEMIAEEKRLLKEYNERPSKKVTEAKARKKRRLQKAMNKIKKKAQVIVDQDINEGSKMKQIQKLYKKEQTKHKEEKKYVVNRNFRNTGSQKAGRNIKMVDTRLKKDKWREKQMKKKNKSFKPKGSKAGKGSGGRGGGGKGGKGMKGMKGGKGGGRGKN